MARAVVVFDREEVGGGFEKDEGVNSHSEESFACGKIHWLKEGTIG